MAPKRKATNDAGSSSAKKPAKGSGPKKEQPKSDYSKVNLNCSAKSSLGNPWDLKISSWNVNGLRAWLEKEGLSFIEQEQPDILCLQETKCTDDKLPQTIKNLNGYNCYWLSGDSAGYSGVGLLSKIKPEKVTYGLGIEEHDKEGRCITAEYSHFFLVGTYVPNSGRGLVRLDYRMNWDKDFREYLQRLDKKKPVILCGDLNVAHKEIDLANPKTNSKTAGFTKEERASFTKLLEESDFLDSFRHLHPDETGAYTFWTYMMNARAKNVGWRLDYFVLSRRLEKSLCESVIRSQILGSDHCPITLFMAMKK